MHHAGLAVLPRQVHQRAGQPGHGPGGPAEAHLGAYPQDTGPRRAHPPAPSFFTPTRLEDPSRPAATSVTSTCFHSR